MKHVGLSYGLKFCSISQSGTHLKQIMETITGISQLVRNLCDRSVWSYAFLWKLQETTQMLLACDDAYVSATKSHVTMEYAPCTGFQSINPVVTTSGCETNALTGIIPGCSIEVVISNISRHRYFLGVGIVGITASTEKHQWISLCESNSRLLLEYPEELQLQTAAGIKTILLVPVLPLGVVQLGSFYELSEDLNMVVQIKDLFLTFQHTLDLQPTFDHEIVNGTAIGSSIIQKSLACLAADAELTDSSNFQPVAMQDWTNLNYDEVVEDEFLQQLMVQPYYDPLPQDGVATNSSDDSFWDAMCNELLTDFSMEQAVIKSSTNTISTLAGDQSILSYRDEEIDRIACLAPEDPIMSDNEFSYDPHHLDEAYLGFVEEFDEVLDSITDGLFLNHPGESIQSGSLFQFHQSAWIPNPSYANELTNSTNIFQVQVPKPVEEPTAIMKDNMADCLAEDKDLESFGYQNSSITQWKDGDFMGSEVSIPGTYTIMPNMPPSNEVQQDTEQELQKGSGKQGKRRGCRRPKPRDRQLIQERITELRKLIPNGSKCSIDELLERAVKHMLFLESVPAHAEKLKKSSRTKVGDGSKFHEKPLLSQNESSFVCDKLETKGNNLPLIIENLEQPDQMLIEIQCRDYGLFLDSAQAFKRLNLTILEGALQSRSMEQQWAHFIIQVPEGFNRMDILWPLTRLLQFQF